MESLVASSIALPDEEIFPAGAGPPGPGRQRERGIGQRQSGADQRIVSFKICRVAERSTPRRLRTGGPATGSVITVAGEIGPGIGAGRFVQRQVQQAAR